MHAVEDLVDFRAGQIVRADIPHDEMSVCAGSDDALASLDQALGDSARIRNHLGAVGLELRSCHLFELNSQGANLVVVGTTLKHGENSEIDFVCELFFAENYA